MEPQHTIRSTVLPAVWHALEIAPAMPAVHWLGQVITRDCLRAKCEALAAQLAAAGITARSRVAVLLPRSPDMLVVLLGLWRLGAVYVPLDPDWPRARIESALSVSAATSLLACASLRPLWERCSCPALLLPAIDYSADTALAARAAPVAVAASDPAYLLFTSGSSGAPKAVQVNHGALATLFAGVLPLLDLQPGCRLLGGSAFCFDIVFFEWLTPLLCAGSLVLVDAATQRDPRALWQLVVTECVSVIQATPSLWRLLLQHASSSSLSNLQLAISTGEALDRFTAEKLLAGVPVLWNLYGPTECTLWCSARRVLDADLHGAVASMPIGQPLPGYTFELKPCGADSAPALPDSPAAWNAAAITGELFISGHCVADGYVGATEAEAARFSVTCGGHRRFRSGDLCLRDANGDHYFLRRCDTQLKINGWRIEAGEIELRLRSHPGLRDAVCLARELDGSTQLLAFVQCEPGAPNKDREHWNRHLQAWLPDWMLPHRYLVVDDFPLGINGKLDRAALLLLAQSSGDTVSCHDDALQAAVAQLFCSVLAIDAVAPCDSFFDLGGNSMLGATLLLVLNQHFGTQLGLRELLRTPPTVLSVTRLLRSTGASAVAF